MDIFAVAGIFYIRILSVLIESINESLKESKGTGLGLAIVKSILERHQIPYGVESVLGEGTSFWFELKKDII